MMQTDNDQVQVDFGEIEGHAWIQTGDAQRILDALGKAPDGDRLKIRIAPSQDENDVEGHGISTSVTVEALPLDDDVEGHAISLHFPTAREADTFRRNLLTAGALTGAIVISGAAIALRPAAAPAAPASQVVDRPAAVVEMQQQAQFLRDQRLMEVSAPSAISATTTAPAGGALAGQQSAQAQREAALSEAAPGTVSATTSAPAGGALAGQQSAQAQREAALSDSGSTGGASAADELPSHGGIIP
jgi:hypothetical protein